MTFSASRPRARRCSRRMLNSDELTWSCATCGEIHRGLPAIAFDAPAHYYSIPAQELSARAHLTSDTCVVDGSAFYVRTVLVVPIVGLRSVLELGVWSSLSETNFLRYQESFTGFDQSKLGPMPSWFASSLPSYPNTLNMRSRILPRDNRKRPLVEFDPSQDHPLVQDVRDGLSLDRAVAFAEQALHRH